MLAGAQDEVELKLELAPDAADSLEAAGLFVGAPEIVLQHAIYFDTPDQDLAAAGLSLRIRRNGTQRVQTIKASGSTAGMFIRPEWERDVDDDIPVIDETTPLLSLLQSGIAEIAPLFVVENERRIWNAEGIEIALDRGRVVAGEREAPFCEVELEQKGGKPAAFFALARGIDAVAPARLGVLSKSERGYRLLGPAMAAVAAGPIRLDADMNAGEAFQAIVGACVSQYRLNERLLLMHQDARALHQARVALRRLRSAVSIHKPMLTDGRGDILNGELRWLAGELGNVRDVDVMIGRIPAGLLRDRLGKARREAAAQAAAALHSRRARALMIDIAEWVAIGEWRSGPEGRDLREQPAREFAAQALDRARRKVRRGGRDLGQLDDEARHDVRKAAKKLRYAAEFFAALYERKRERRWHRRFVAALEQLQDQLGALNDLAAAPLVLREFGAIDDPQAAVLLDTVGKADLVEAAAEAHDALVDARRFWR